ncbi:hypothetical protein ACO0LF_31345 [Undibacterium sp. Di27W]|uniref:hypothetical protein n=1 Tax=Undibacterium sp. Di27W TaxID=3413036 RepID=UPI003BEFF760
MDENGLILECDFSFKCPKTWESLTVLDDPEKRFCSSCEREVFFIRSRQELEVFRRLGRCIAASVHDPIMGAKVAIGGIGLIGDTEIHVFGDRENVDELMVAMDRHNRKKNDKDKQ